MRDRLIALLKSPHKAEQMRQKGVDIGKYEDDCVEAMIADFLLANGVIVPPVKVRQTIYALWMGGRKGIGVAEFRVISINLDTPDDVEIVYRSKKLNATMVRYAKASDIGKTLFLTREEAEKALERSAENAEQNS